MFGMVKKRRSGRAGRQVGLLLAPLHMIHTPAQNWREVQTVVHLVRYYYRLKEFCIITPYDAQRNAIQKTLKAEKLPWESVFNVDTFQGEDGI